MKADSAHSIAVVDDDSTFRDSLIELLGAAGWESEAYASASAMIAADPWSRLGCIVADIEMPGMSGVELQEWLVRHEIGIPLIVVTGRAEISTAVRSIKAGALDYLQKPFETQTLLELVDTAVGLRKSRLEEQRRREEIFALYDSLTAREREVFAVLLSGRMNKEIAFTLGISVRTVEVHRGRVMQKMRARNLPHLIEMTFQAKLPTSSPRNSF